MKYFQFILLVLALLAISGWTQPISSAIGAVDSASGSNVRAKRSRSESDEESDSESKESSESQSKESTESQSEESSEESKSKKKEKASSESSSSSSSSSSEEVTTKKPKKSKGKKRGRENDTIKKGRLIYAIPEY